MTVFIDRDGKTAYIHTGPYTSDRPAQRRHRALPRLMPEVRVDPLTGLKTIIAGERARPPRRRRSTSPPDAPSTPRRTRSCPGNEDQTPPELYRDGDPWRVRVFPNKLPGADRGARASPSERGSPLIAGFSLRGDYPTTNRQGGIRSKRFLYLTLAIIALLACTGSFSQEPPTLARMTKTTRSPPTPFPGVRHPRSSLPAHNLLCWKAIPTATTGDFTGV